MTDEQRVALWVAHARGKERAHFVRVLDVEEHCKNWWYMKGTYRQPSTWLRAFWRARAAGMLGPVEPPVRRKGRYYYRITGSVASIRRAAGAGYKTIPHGNRKRKGGDAA